MLRSFEQVVRPYIPVVAHTKQRVIPPPLVPRPDVGIRWGKPSRFEFSQDDKDQSGGGSIIIDDEESATVTGTEVYREWEKVTAAAIDAPAITFEFERPKEMFFFIEATEVTEETINENGNIQPEITKTFHYVRISFTLNATGETIGETGERGEHPDDTLAQTQSDYDNTVAGGIQKSKEFWEGMFS